MYSYHARVHQSHAEATAKAAAVVVAYTACDRPGSPDADFQAAVDELDARLWDLQTAVSALNRILPPEIGSENELSRHVEIGRHKVNKRRPWEWRGDPQTILNRDLPNLLERFEAWYETASGIDPEYVRRLESFDRGQHINSAEREAWVIFKSRVVDEFDLSSDLDGYDLVAALLGDNGPASSILKRDERAWLKPLLKGLYSLHRNLIMHNDIPPNPAASEAVIALLGIYLARLTGHTNPTAAQDRAD